MMPKESGNITPQAGRLSEGQESREICLDGGNPAENPNLGSGGPDRADVLRAAGGDFSQEFGGGIVAEQRRDVTPHAEHQLGGQGSRGNFLGGGNPAENPNLESGGQDRASVRRAAGGQSGDLIT